MAAAVFGILAEVTLVWVLFSDAARVRFGTPAGLVSAALNPRWPPAWAGPRRPPASRAPARHDRASAASGR